MASTASMADQSLPASAAPAATTTAKPASRRNVIILVVVVVLAAAGIAYWLHARQFEETDDAQVDGNISNVSPRTSGQIKAVFVVENQHVDEGQPLAEIDETDLQIAVEQARAQVANAEALRQAEDPSVPITQATNVSALASATSDIAGASAGLSAARKEVAQLTAQLAQAEANDRTAQLDKDRATKLIGEGAIAQADFDARNNAAVASSANLDALRQSLAAARDRVNQQQAQIGALQSHLVEVRSNAPRQIATREASVVGRQASLDLAKAQLAQAEKNLSYARILAPVRGIVAKKSVAVGDHVAPGQELMAIAQNDDLWITADYRETQLERMHPGQPAKVHIDGLNLDLNGTVESIGGATGSRLSVLPPENATGNYVKVVQRIPVRIRLDRGQSGLDALRIGMSAEPSVTVR
jgi:membrane fusion protein (multidrug efflux system)